MGLNAVVVFLDSMMMMVEADAMTLWNGFLASGGYNNAHRAQVYLILVGMCGNDTFTVTGNYR